MVQERDLEVVPILKALVAGDVRFVVIGGVAAIMHGAGVMTRDLDILYSRERENIRRLWAALKELDPRRVDLPSGVQAPFDERAILNGMNFVLGTRHGRLDLIGETSSGRFTYEAIRPTADLLSAEELTFPVVSLKNLRRMKRAAGRPKDLQMLSHLDALDDEIDLRESAASYASGPRAVRSRGARRGTARPVRRSFRTKAR